MSGTLCTVDSLHSQKQQNLVYMLENCSRWEVCDPTLTARTGKPLILPRLISSH